MKNTIDSLRYLYSTFGTETYQENCTQLQHAQQCGTLALEQGLGEEMALAAFLHDIGHLIADKNALSGFNAYGYADHDQLGADYLATCGFSERIVRVIKEHVQVKRYLAATEPGYCETLSHASTQTLEMQGGKMNEHEVRVYSESAYLEDIIQLRRLDDSGKQPEMTCKDLDFWLMLAQKHLSTKERE